ncbi:organic radical activating enzyme [Rubidibacter lacunae KORDI 51-2]|uniref:7-carboxy-7-deazaguanine synthase n=1 Tax=Rubidibacter lacunae KORDI 51-2 TaxID=582515 RepID=U5D6D8_9CHRO|nr:7-carboxy-7-deazaguanine synthase QueE [Rubidibacter lacunae]ERN40208.1 organic radical activating enzyme [Rubidibacter lacunae KORDI 51-2]
MTTTVPATEPTNTAAAVLTVDRANLVEVFSAIQGEGSNVGTRQIFIRFARCDLRCHFCDSARTWGTPATCRIEATPGARDFETHANPVTRSQLLAWVVRQHVPGLHDSISLTGGEPLLHASFLQTFLPEVRRLGLPIYLETGGHHPQQLSAVLPFLDAVGADLKLPSVSGEQRWQAHADFLKRCCDAGVEVFAKLIVSDRTDRADLERAAAIVAGTSPEIPVFLQPVTPLAEPLAVGAISPPTPAQVLAWQALLKQQLACVRVVPQTHKAIGQL